MIWNASLAAFEDRLDMDKEVVSLNGLTFPFKSRKKTAEAIVE